MKKLRKMFVLMGTVTLMVNFCSFNILAEDGIINGKKYKRLWSADKNAWVDPYWTLA